MPEDIRTKNFPTALAADYFASIMGFTIVTCVQTDQGVTVTLFPNNPGPSPIPSPTGFCPIESMDTVWACLERLPENALSDTERDDLNTAMAWIKEAVEADPR